MKAIAVLLTVHNRKVKTLQCLRNLYAQQGVTDCQLHVYLTDDGCTDGTAEAIREQYPAVHIVEGDGSLYWNRGMHRAWEAAVADAVDYDYYLWLNDDTNITADCLQRLLTHSHEQQDRAIIVGSTSATGHPEQVTYGGWSDGRLITDLSHPASCQTMNGNIVLIPRAVYDVLGMNDATFRHCLGDTDYCLRAGEQGIPCLTGVGLFGTCDLHEHMTVWMDPSQPFMKRWRNFMGPLGNNPFEFFYFRRKHYGVLAACATFASNWIHFFFPRLWVKKQ